MRGCRKCASIFHFTLVVIFRYSESRGDLFYTGNTRRQRDREPEMLLVGATFIALLVIDTGDAAKSILQSPNDVINTEGKHINSSETDSYVQLADGKILKRDKRFLLFSGGGISKVWPNAFSEQIDNIFRIVSAGGPGFLGTRRNTWSRQLAYFEFGV